MVVEVYIRYPRAGLYVNPGMTDVTVFRPIHFTYKGIKCYVKPKFPSDCASVPMWWAVAALVVAKVGLIISTIWFYTPYFVAILLAMEALGLMILWLRKSNLLPVGIIHDCMYAGQVRPEKVPIGDPDKARIHIPRKSADEWFRRALIEYTMPRTPRPLRHVAAFIAWGAVRLFGRSRYNKA